MVLRILYIKINCSIKIDRELAEIHLTTPFGLRKLPRGPVLSERKEFVYFVYEITVTCVLYLMKYTSGLDGCVGAGVGM